MKLALPSIRQTSLLVFLFCGGLLAVSAYFQLVMKFMPCPLCVIQRYLYLIIGIVYFIGSLYQPRIASRRVYYIVCVFLAILGLVVSGRQVWLQNVAPHQLTTCGANFNYIIENYPIFNALQIMFAGVGICSEPQWSFLNFSIAQWSMANFSILLIFGLWQIIRK